MWVRPPNITFNGIEAPTSGNEVNLVSNGFNIDFNLNVSLSSTQSLIGI